MLILVLCFVGEPEPPLQEWVLATEQMWAAAQCGDAPGIEAALAAGAHVNARDGMGNTALLIAACWDHPDATRLLIRRGADVNFFSRGYGTALGAAARHGRLAVVDDLLDAGADANVPNEKGYAPLLWCAGSHRVDAPDVAAAHVRGGADPNRADENGTTPLNAALSAGNHRVASVLMRHGAQPPTAR